MRTLALDWEAVAIADAATYDTDPIEAPANYKNPDAIDAYITKERARRLERAALDIDLAQPICLATWRSGDEAAPTSKLIRTEDEERAVLRQLASDYNNADRVLVYNGAYDLALAQRRAQLLGVTFPWIPLNKYRNTGRVLDLMQYLSFDGLLKWRGLKWYGKRFGLEPPTPHKGADVAQLWREGRTDEIQRYCEGDVALLVALAARLGILESQDFEPLATGEPF